MFPYYTTDDDKGYIFSALNCPCSLEDFSAAVDAGTITATYQERLIANMYNAGKEPNTAYFGVV